MNRAVLPYPAHIDGNGVAVAEGKFLSLPLPLDQMNVSDAFKDRFTNSDDTQPSLASALHGIALDPSPRPGQGSEPACVLPRLRPAASRQALRRRKRGAGNPTCPEAAPRSARPPGVMPPDGRSSVGLAWHPALRFSPRPRDRQPPRTEHMWERVWNSGSCEPS